MMPRTTYRPEPGTREHDRQKERKRAGVVREVRVIDRAIQALERYEVRPGQVIETLNGQRATVYGLLA